MESKQLQQIAESWFDAELDKTIFQESKEAALYYKEQYLATYRAGFREGQKQAQPGAVWVKGVKGFPVKKIVVAKFKHYDDPLRGWVIGHASSSTGEMITFDWGVSSITLQMDHPRWEILYWLDESATPAAGREEAVELLRWLNENDWSGVGSGEYINSTNGRILKEEKLYQEFKRRGK